MKKIMMTLLAIALPFLPMSIALSAEAMQALASMRRVSRAFPLARHA
jgi:hypothetical protein